MVEKFDPEVGRWMPAGRSREPTLQVENLEPGHEYKFRVCAVNSEGESEPLEGLDSIIAKNPFDPPDPPGKPEAVDWDKDFVDLEWPMPKDDGGSPITGWIIQKREKGSPYWTTGVKLNSPNNNGRVPNLTEGQEYEFRVIAVNKVGNSEPSEPSDSVICRPRRRKILHNLIWNINGY